MRHQESKSPSMKKFLLLFLLLVEVLKFAQVPNFHLAMYKMAIKNNFYFFAIFNKFTIFSIPIFVEVGGTVRDVKAEADAIDIVG